MPKLEARFIGTDTISGYTSFKDRCEVGGQIVTIGLYLGDNPVKSVHQRIECKMDPQDCPIKSGGNCKAKLEIDGPNGTTLPFIGPKITCAKEGSELLREAQLNQESKPSLLDRLRFRLKQ